MGWRGTTVKTPALTITAAVVALVLAAVVLWQTPWGSLPSGLQPASASTDFTIAEIESAHAFRSTLRWLSILSLVIGVALLALVAFTATGARWAAKVPGGPLGRAALLVLILSLLVFLARLPVGLTMERIARREGLSTTTWSSWAIDQAKGLAISLVLTTVVVVAVVALATRMPTSWWISAASGAAVLTILMSFLFPVVFEPIFNRFTPMPDGSLRTSLMDLAQRDGVPVRDVLVADASRRTTALNAYVSGFGATRRIVVYDTLLASAPDREVAMVVAHELGHAKQRDVLTGTLVGALAAALGVLALAWLIGPRITTPAGVAALLAWLAIFSLLQQPAAHAISRQIEARADLHALRLTQDPQTFAEMQRRLATTNRADVIAPRWAYLLFASHPSTRERIALARWWAERQDKPVPGPLAPR